MKYTVIENTEKKTWIIITVEHIRRHTGVYLHRYS